jgi:hypothetical protein
MLDSATAQTHLTIIIVVVITASMPALRLGCSSELRNTDRQTVSGHSDTHASAEGDAMDTLRYILP